MDTISELVYTGKQYFEQKDYHNAEAYLLRVLEKTDRYADVLNMMGVIHHADGRFSSAIEMFKRALSINPRYTEALMNLAVLYNDLGQYDDAKRLYQQLKKIPRSKGQTIEPVLRGKLSNLHASIGDIYRSAGVHKHAIDEYEKALQLNPTYVDIKTKLGQSLREDGQSKKALKVLKDAIKAKSSYSPARIQLGLTYYAMGKTADAKREWKAALAKDPSNDYAKMYLRLLEAMSTPKKKSSKGKGKR
jgi:tetratricopeptide (TPR) repeat protein